MAIALAASSPCFRPPLAISGNWGAARWVAISASAVGMPHSEKARASSTSSGRSRRNASTRAKLVPPMPATSIAATPAWASWAATGPEMPQPTSLTITGTGSSAHSVAIFSVNPLKLWSPSGWSASCSGLRCSTSASASIISIASRHCSVRIP